MQKLKKIKIVMHYVNDDEVNNYAWNLENY